MHKEFLMGNEAIALGALASGVNLVAGYPGTPSTEITEQAAKYDDMAAQLDAQNATAPTSPSTQAQDPTTAVEEFVPVEEPTDPDEESD